MTSRSQQMSRWRESPSAQQCLINHREVADEYFDRVQAAQTAFLRGLSDSIRRSFEGTMNEGKHF